MGKNTDIFHTKPRQLEIATHVVIMLPVKDTVLKPTQVNWLNKLRRRENHLEGTRQNNSVTSAEGGPRCGVARNWGWRLFTKNTGPCKMVT